MENAAIVIKLAWRNVWRNRRRTILTLLTIVVGCGMIIFLNAIAKGGHDRMIEDAISINTGHIQIHEKGFWDNLTIDYAFRPSQDLIHELESNPRVAAYSRRIHAAALLSFGDTSTGAIIEGVEPGREQNVTTLHSKILPGGRYLKKGDTKTMLLGVTLAQNLGVSTGKQIALISQGFDGSIAADMFTIAGLIKSGNPEYDKMLAVIPFAQANRTFAMMDYVHAVTVRLHASDQTDQVVAALKSRAPGGETQLEVMGWDRLMPVLVQFIIMDDVSAWIFDFILLMLVAFGILNTIQMSVFERTREFGIMLSIGTRPGQVTAIVLAESVFISTLGILLGIALGLLVSWYFALHPMDYSSIAAETAVWGVTISTMPADATLTNVAVTSLLTFTFAMLFSVFPARRAAKLNPVDAVRQLQEGVMKILIMLGWRNIWRNKRRSFVVISSIAFGIFAMILSMGFMNGMNRQMVENTIRTSLGHIAIHRRGFQDSMKLRYNFRPSEKIMRALSADPEISGYAPRITMEGIIRSSETSRPITVVGIDPEKEKSITGVYTYTIRKEGSRFLREGDINPVLISTSLGDKLGLVPGDRLVLMFQDKSKEIVGLGMTITGLYRTPVENFDKYTVFTTLSLLRKETGLGEKITGITIHLKNSRAVDSVKEALIHAVDDDALEILSWKDMAPNLVSAVKLFDSMMYIFFGIIFIVVIFSIANTLVMAIMERFHEIGVMKSIGTRPLWIFTMIMIEAVFLGIVGLTAGLIIGSSVTALLSATGIDFSFYMESMRTWGTGSIIYPAVKTMDIVAAVIIVMITTILAALYPAVKAARIRPLEALHFV